MRTQAIVVLGLAVAAGLAFRQRDDERSKPSVRVERSRPQARASVPTLPSNDQPAAEPLETPQRESLDEMLARSPAADGAWTLEIEKRMRDVLADPRIEGSRMREMQCRGELCKVTLEHREDARNDLRLALIGFPSSQMEGRIVDATTTALYIQR